MNWLSKTAITLIVLLVFIFISGNWSGSCAARQNVEADLMQRSSADLEKAGFRDVAVSVNGLIVQLDGFVKNEDEKKRAGEVVKAMEMNDHTLGCGGHTFHPVNNRLKIREAPASLRWLTQAVTIDKSQDKDKNLAGIQWDAIFEHKNMEQGQDVALSFMGSSEKLPLTLKESSLGSAAQQSVRFTLPEDCSPCRLGVASPSMQVSPLSLNVKSGSPYGLRFLDAPKVLSRKDDLDRSKPGIQYDLQVEHLGVTPPKNVEVFKTGPSGPTGASLGQGTLKLSSVDKKWKMEPIRVSLPECPNCKLVGVIKDEKGSAVGTPTLIDVQSAEALQIENDIAELVRLQNVEFNSGSADLTKRGMNTVKKVAALLLKAENIRVEIQGYTDSMGNDDINQTLSDARARRVGKALVNLGVDGKILTQRGFGEARPVASNDTAKGRARNRRIEFIVSRR